MHICTLKMEAARSSETCLRIHQIRRAKPTPGDITLYSQPLRYPEYSPLNRMSVWFDRVLQTVHCSLRKERLDIGGSNSRALHKAGVLLHVGRCWTVTTNLIFQVVPRSGHLTATLTDWLTDWLIDWLICKWLWHLTFSHLMTYIYIYIYIYVVPHR